MLVWVSFLSQSADVVADSFAVGAEGEDGEGTFVVLRVKAMAVSGFEDAGFCITKIEELLNILNKKTEALKEVSQIQRP